MEKRNITTKTLHRDPKVDQRATGAGKGDSPRPISYHKWANNYDRIFRKDKSKTNQ